MKRITLKALSWGHRRATGPLGPLSQRFAAIRPDIAIEWVGRPLSGFEHQPISDAARQVDLVIYDHPFSGDIVAVGAFLRLDEAMPDLLGPDAGQRYVGPSLASYSYGGGVWGAPIDAATQHAIYRADLLAAAGESVPRTWQEVLALGRRLKARKLHLGLAVVAPHAILVAGALMANRGRPWSTDPDAPFAIDRDGLRAALGNVLDLLAFAPPEALAWNSIDLHEAMVARDDIAYAPCVYGYATYGEADMRRRLSFADFPGPSSPHPAGTAIGGTALGVSAFTREPEAALAFVRLMLSPEAQVEIIPAHHGQPALVAAWDDPAVDARFNGYFRDVRATVDQAWVRPRLRSYIRFQHDAGRVVERLARCEIGMEDAISDVLASAEQVGDREEVVR